MRKLLVLAFTAALILAPSSDACPGNGSCKGNGQQHRHGQGGQGGQGRHGQGGQGHGHGMKCRMDESHAADMDVFHFLLDNREKITRTVTRVDQGVETLTESNDPEIVAKIQEHVTAMQARLTEDRPIHVRDPLFAEIFANADKIEMKIEETEKGARVTETSTDDYVAKLIQAHAEVIDKFLQNGRPEMRENHEVPQAR